MVKFGIYTKILLVDNIRKTCCKWTVDNDINSSKINIIIILITNLKFEISSNKDNFIPIYYYKVAKINNQNKNHIKKIN